MMFSTAAVWPTTRDLTKDSEQRSVHRNQKRSRGSIKRLTVTGRLTDEGVECQALRSNNGVLYTLSGNLRGFKAGDKVRVVGKVSEVSTCQQGTTLSVETIKRAK